MRLATVISFPFNSTVEYFIGFYENKVEDLGRRGDLRHDVQKSNQISLDRLNFVYRKSENSRLQLVDGLGEPELVLKLSDEFDGVRQVLFLAFLDFFFGLWLADAHFDLHEVKRIHGCVELIIKVGLRLQKSLINCLGLRLLAKQEVKFIFL